MRVSGPGINIDQQAFNDFLTNREGINREDHLYKLGYTKVGCVIPMII